MPYVKADSFHAYDTQESIIPQGINAYLAIANFLSSCYLCDDMSEMQ